MEALNTWDEKDGCDDEDDYEEEVVEIGSTRKRARSRGKSRIFVDVGIETETMFVDNPSYYTCHQVVIVCLLPMFFFFVFSGLWNCSCRMPLSNVDVNILALARP